MSADEFWDSDEGQGFLKAGFLGFNKSGKTMTAALLAVAAREVLGLQGGIGFFDTETGSSYVKPIVEKLTGKKMRVKKSRSLSSLLEWGRRCVEEGLAGGVVDSITHPWRELCDSYLKELNETREKLKRSTQKRLEFQDWNTIKPRWAEWTDFYINSPLCIAICGRAGWEYEMEKDEDGKKQLNKTGVKMKTEGEFGFEPSLLVQMEMEQILKPGSIVPEIMRRATVLGERFSVMDGQAMEFRSVDVRDPAQLTAAYEAVKKFFLPHLQMLTPGAHAIVDTEARTEFGLNEDGRAAWDEEKRQRTILCEEIQSELTSAYPGQSASEKKIKTDLVKQCFGTGSWTRVEGMKSGDLRAGLEMLRGIIKASSHEKAPAETPAA